MLREEDPPTGGLKEKGVYPGTFDPVTYGHLDIIRRALPLVDRLVVGVSTPPTKDPLFSAEERVAMLRAAIAEMLPKEAPVTVTHFEGLLVDFCTHSQAKWIIRGVRTVSDFEWESQLAGVNATLAPEIDTLFLPASQHTHHISSRFVRGIARLRGNLLPFVPPLVAKALMSK